MAFIEDRRILKVKDLASGAVKTFEDRITNYRSGDMACNGVPTADGLRSRL